MATNDASEILAAWETSSQYWNKHQALIEKMFAPLTRALIEATYIRAGHTVLDVGGGSGEPSLTIAPIVGESGSVNYTDPVAGMVRTARDEAEHRGLTNIHFQEAPAEQLPFSDSSFDVAVGRLSVMFFPDVLGGFREILRVTKPGGYLSFVVWAAKEINPFFTVVTEILDQFVVPDVEDEDAPYAFRFAKPGKLAGLLKQAGATSVTERSVPFRIEAPIDIERFWELRTEMSDTLRERLAKLTANQVSVIRGAVENAAANYFEKAGMSFPAQALIVTGRKAH